MDAPACPGATGDVVPQDKKPLLPEPVACPDLGALDLFDDHRVVLAGTPVVGARASAAMSRPQQEQEPGGSRREDVGAANGHTKLAKVVEALLGVLLDEVADRVSARLAPKLAAERTDDHREKRLLDIEEAAKRLGISTSTLYKRTRAQAIPHIKLGSRVLFEPGDLDALVAQKRRTPEQVAAFARSLNNPRRR